MIMIISFAYKNNIKLDFNFRSYTKTYPRMIKVLNIKRKSSNFKRKCLSCVLSTKREKNHFTLKDNWQGCLGGSVG